MRVEGEFEKKSRKILWIIFPFTYPRRCTYKKDIPLNIHSDMFWIARKTIQTRIIKPEQDSNPHLPISGRLFYVLNYLMLFLMLNSIADRNICWKIKRDMWWSVLFIEKEEGFYMDMLLSRSFLISSCCIPLCLGYSILSARSGCLSAIVKAPSWLSCSCSHSAFEFIL